MHAHAALMQECCIGHSHTHTILTTLHSQVGTPTCMCNSPSAPYVKGLQRLQGQGHSMQSALQVHHAAVLNKPHSQVDSDRQGTMAPPSLLRVWSRLHLEVRRS